MSLSVGRMDTQHNGRAVLRAHRILTLPTDLWKLLTDNILNSESSSSQSRMKMRVTDLSGILQTKLQTNS